MLDAVGRGRGHYYTLSKATSDILKDEMNYERQLNLDDEAVKMRILTLLKENDLNNHDIIKMTGWDRKKVHKVIKELGSSGVVIVGKGRAARYTLHPETENL